MMCLQATDCSGYYADGLIHSVRAFSSAHWAVRNSASLAFTSLLERMVGYKNMDGKDSSRTGITAFEFFHRYPKLHSFLQTELREAALQLQEGRHKVLFCSWVRACVEEASTNVLRVRSQVHPSLFPVMVLLSRLRPSVLSDNLDDALSPMSFIIDIVTCTVTRHALVRALAARALAPLVPPAALRGTILAMVESLYSDKQVAADSSRAACVPSMNMIHGTLLSLIQLLSRPGRSEEFILSTDDCSQIFASLRLQVQKFFFEVGLESLDLALHLRVRLTCNPLSP
eukprot:scaffold412_cov388-Prasinococcus_capsulatus_cf.AAC.23